MSPVPSYRAKRDDNEAEIIAVFRAEGWGVVQNSARGVWDLFVYDNRGEWPLPVAYVEVKGRYGKLTEDQERWAAQHPKLPKFIARTTDDAREISRRLRGPVSWEDAWDRREAELLERQRSPKDPEAPA